MPTPNRPPTLFRFRRGTAASFRALAGALAWGAVELVALARSRRVRKAVTNHA